MKHDDTKVTPLSRYLNDSTLGQLVVVDGLMGLLLFSVEPKGSVTVIAEAIGLLLVSSFALYRAFRSIGVINQAPEVKNSRDGLTLLVMLFLYGSGVFAFYALGQSIANLGRLL